MKRFMIVAAALAALTGIVRADTETDIYKKALDTLATSLKSCKEKAPSDKDLINCYNSIENDAVALNDKIKDLDAKRAQQAAAAPVEYKLVDAGDVYVNPDKFVNRAIEIRKVRCYYANVGDYRCGASAGRNPLTIFAKEVTPPDVAQRLQRDCETLKDMVTPKCTVTVRFTPASTAEDTLSGYVKRRTLNAKSIEIIDTPARSRR